MKKKKILLEFGMRKFVKVSPSGDVLGVYETNDPTVKFEPEIDGGAIYEVDMTADLEQISNGEQNFDKKLIKKAKE